MDETVTTTTTCTERSNPAIQHNKNHPQVTKTAHLLIHQACLESLALLGRCNDMRKGMCLGIGLSWQLTYSQARREVKGRPLLPSYHRLIALISSCSSAGLLALPHPDMSLVPKLCAVSSPLGGSQIATAVYGRKQPQSHQSPECGSLEGITSKPLGI
jgi:hypothetical protein